MRTPKGTRVFYPEDSEPRREIERTIEEVIRRYGFSQVRTPAFDAADVYKEKSGEEIVEQLYSLDSEVGNRELVLMPELTPTVGRMVASERQGLKQPIKWYSTRRFWRYEAVQQGRFREFWQTNLDLFGVGEPQGEAEILRVITDVFSELGISSEDVQVYISDRRALESLVQSFSDETVDVSDVMRVVDKRNKLEQEEYEQKLRRSGVSNVSEFDRLLTERSIRVLRDELGDVVEPLERLLDNVEGISEWLTLDLGTARGLDYYTGIVFEAFDVTGAVSRSLLGGGRYNSLVGNYDSEGIPAVGMAFGYATLEEALDAYSLSFSDAGTLDFYVIRFEDTADATRDIADVLRNRGYRVEEALQNRSIGSQFGIADERDATYAVVLGPDEVSRGCVKVQELESGNESEVNISELDSVEFSSLF